MAKLASQVYGDALFELAVEDHEVDAMAEEVREVKRYLLGSPELENFMAHAALPAEEKEKALCAVAEKAFGKQMCGFLKLVLEKGHYEQLPAILEHFLDRVRTYKKIGVVYITTPMELRQEQTEMLEEKILKTSGYNKLECHYVTDPSLIGGLVIRMQDRVLDSSLKTQLANLKNSLMDIQVAGRK